MSDHAKHPQYNVQAVLLRLQRYAENDPAVDDTLRGLDRYDMRLLLHYIAELGALDIGKWTIEERDALWDRLDASIKQHVELRT